MPTFGLDGDQGPRGAGWGPIPERSVEAEPGGSGTFNSSRSGHWQSWLGF